MFLIFFLGQGPDLRPSVCSSFCWSCFFYSIFLFFRVRIEEIEKIEKNGTSYLFSFFLLPEWNKGKKRRLLFLHCFFFLLSEKIKKKGNIEKNRCLQIWTLTQKIISKNKKRQKKRGSVFSYFVNSNSKKIENIGKIEHKEGSRSGPWPRKKTKIKK